MQLFAGDGNGAEGGADGGADGNGDGAEGDKNNEPMSFDDFLKQEGNQAEFDKRLQKAINTAVTNAKAKWELLANEEASEAEKLKNMTKEQKAEYRAQQLEKELNELKRKAARSEMTNTARKMLSEEGVNIPDELLSNIVFDEAEKTQSSVAAFTTLYKAAVQEGVKAALKGGNPKKGSGSKTMTKDQILAVKDPAERQKLIAENIELFK